MENIIPSSEKAPELKFAPIVPNVWQALDELKRTGWIDRKVANPESVQEHTIALRNIAASLFDDLTEEEKDGLLDMLEVHDWPEAIHGDEVILSVDEKEFATLHATKFEREKIALASICEKMGEAGKEVMGLWLRFETSSDDATSFAKQLDKYQAIEKALEYEKDQKIPLFREFFEYSRKKVTHPILVKRMEKLEAEWKEMQNGQ